MTFSQVIQGLRNGDFSGLDPVFAGQDIIEWYRAGLFKDHPEELNEALTCACFNNRVEIVRFLLFNGVKSEDGTMTGMDAFHWAANRGQLETVELLIKSGANMETLNSYGGTVLDCTVWSTIHETKPNHLAILKTLIDAGADKTQVGLPTGNAEIDALFTE